MRDHPDDEISDETSLDYLGGFHFKVDIEEVEETPSNYLPSKKAMGSLGVEVVSTQVTTKVATIRMLESDTMCS